jgi:hypothetical protein
LLAPIKKEYIEYTLQKDNFDWPTPSNLDEFDGIQRDLMDSAASLDDMAYFSTLFDFNGLVEASETLDHQQLCRMIGMRSLILACRRLYGGMVAVLCDIGTNIKPPAQSYKDPVDLSSRHPSERSSSNEMPYLARCGWTGDPWMLPGFHRPCEH